jgi:hypothetical protein
MWSNFQADLKIYEVEKELNLKHSINTTQTSRGLPL